MGKDQFPRMSGEYAGVSCHQGTSKPFMITIHQTQSGDAEGAARYLKTRPDGSCHYVIDSHKGFKCAEDDAILCHVGGQNTGNIGIELAGYSTWTARTWRSSSNRRMVAYAAWLTARKMRQHDIPASFALEPARLPANRFDFGGVTTHRSLSLKYRTSTHTDPGLGFPKKRFRKLVRFYKANPSVRRPVSMREIRRHG